MGWLFWFSALKYSNRHFQDHVGRPGESMAEIRSYWTTECENAGGTVGTRNSSWEFPKSLDHCFYSTLMCQGEGKKVKPHPVILAINVCTSTNPDCTTFNPDSC